jgi:hypothetical protein
MKALECFLLAIAKNNVEEIDAIARTIDLKETK